MDLLALQTILREFAAQRDWQPFHTPKNLSTALMVEAAELAEIFQWMTAEESQRAHDDALLKERIGEEVADVLLYLLQLADHSQIDLKRAVGRKLAMNAKKHPPVRTAVPMEEKTVLPQTHVLVDWENVQPKDVDIRQVVPDVTDVRLFHGPHQKRVEVHHASFGDRVTPVPIVRTGKNALDFHLSFYMGYIASRHPQTNLVVTANDRGYGPMIDHAIGLGFAARQAGFGISEGCCSRHGVCTWHSKMREGSDCRLLRRVLGQCSLDVTAFSARSAEPAGSSKRKPPAASRTR